MPATPTATPAAAAPSAPAAAPAAQPATPARDPLKLAKERLGYKAKQDSPASSEAPATPAAPAAQAAPATPAAPAAPAPAAPAAATTPAAPTPAPAAAPDDRTLRRNPPKPAESLTAEVVKSATAAGVQAGLEAARAAQPAAPAATAEPKLQPDDQAEYDLARFAAESKDFAERYGDMPQRLLEYYRARDAHIAAKQKELGGVTELREYLDSEEFKSFVRSARPSFKQGDRQKIHETRIVHQATEAAAAEARKREDALKKELLALKHKDEIAADLNKVVSQVLDGDDELLAAFRKDPGAARAERGIEAADVAAVSTDIRGAAEEYLKITRGIVDPDEQNATHAWLGEFIAKQEEDLEAIPEDKRVRDGRVIVSLDRYTQLVKADPRNAGRYAKLTDADILHMLGVYGNAVIKRRISDTRKRLEASGYVRKPASAPPATPAGDANAEAAASPRASSSPPPAQGEVAGRTKPLHMRVLGYDRS